MLSEDEHKGMCNENIQVYQQKHEACFFFKKKQKQREDTEANLRTAQVFASSG